MGGYHPEIRLFDISSDNGMALNSIRTFCWPANKMPGERGSRCHHYLTLVLLDSGDFADARVDRATALACAA